jgi:hypothetical protein
MQQRRLRLGDILDDYCPRERRLTNHVVVAMIDDDVKQTRCSTCDAEHEYKQGKTPAPRRKNPGALSQDLPEGARPRAVVPSAAAHETLPEATDDDFESDGDSDGDAIVPVGDATTATDDQLNAAADEAEPVDDPIPEREDDGFVHRRLIRATLPRPEGHVPERKEPDFTMRQPAGRDFNGNRNGQRPRGPRGARQAQGQYGGGPNRSGGQGAGAQRHGSGAPHGQGQGGQRQGNRPGQPSSNRGGGGRPGGQNRGNGRKRGR